MKSFTLNIAGYNIRFESSEDGPAMMPGKRFKKFIRPLFPQEALADTLVITVFPGKISIPASAVRVFHAPYVEETGGTRHNISPEFWNVWKNGDELLITTVFPSSRGKRNAVVKLSLDSRKWYLWIDGPDCRIDPFEYPLDGLILYYLTAMNRDILIHASGVNKDGKGYLFSGISGQGKSTMAGLWNDSGATVIHDDRLVIRKQGDRYMMYNTPVYDNEEPRESGLDRIFIIGHGDGNRITPVTGAAAVSLVIANCIQHNWDISIIQGLLGSVSEMCSKVPVARLAFLPDKSVTDHILAYG